jgi:hypothetical protein
MFYVEICVQNYSYQKYVLKLPKCPQHPIIISYGFMCQMWLCDRKRCFILQYSTTYADVFCVLLSSPLSFFFIVYVSVSRNI